MLATKKRKGDEAIEKIIKDYLGEGLPYYAVNKLRLKTAVGLVKKPLEPLLQQINALPDK